jgi:hypothetical protein
MILYIYIYIYIHILDQWPARRSVIAPIGELHRSEESNNEQTDRPPTFEPPLPREHMNIYVRPVPSRPDRRPPILAGNIDSSLFAPGDIHPPGSPPTRTAATPRPQLPRRHGANWSALRPGQLANAAAPDRCPPPPRALPSGPGARLPGLAGHAATRPTTAQPRGSSGGGARGRARLHPQSLPTVAAHRLPPDLPPAPSPLLQTHRPPLGGNPACKGYPAHFRLGGDDLVWGLLEAVHFPIQSGPPRLAPFLRTKGT